MDTYKFTELTYHDNTRHTHQQLLAIENGSHRIALHPTLTDFLNEHGTASNYKFTDFGHGYAGLEDEDGDVEFLLITNCIDIIEEVLDNAYNKKVEIPDALLILMAKARLEI